MTIAVGPSSKLFTPLKIGNGKIELKHRVVLAPLTRNRGSPLNVESTPENPNRNWYPNDMVAEYYAQRTTDGGLLISEGINPSLQGGGMPGTTGIWLDEHISGWKKVVDAIHAKGGYIYAQLWHQGRTTISPMTGLPSVSPSGLPWDNNKDVYSHIPPGMTERVPYAKYPPIEMTVEQIESTIQDFCTTAKKAIELCGFDGIEVHGGNGYLPEQFLSSNINVRTDAYGGTPEKRGKFVIDLMTALADAVGPENVAIRLSPFGLFNQTRGVQRLETWGHLCRELKAQIPNMSYVSFIEPRFEQIHSYNEKDSFLESWGLATVDLSLFREIFGDTPFFSAGGFNDQNSWGVLESGAYDALLYGRYFISNPDLPQRLRDGKPLRMYERDRFYGPFPDNERGYTDYPAWSEGETN